MTIYLYLGTFRTLKAAGERKKNYLERGKNTQNLSISLSDVDAALMGEVDWIESFTMCASLTPHHWKRPSNLSSLPKATAGPGAYQTSPAADALHWPAGSSLSTDTCWISTSTVSCGWISAGASARAEESWRKEQCHPHGVRNGDSPAKPSTAEHTANSSRREEWTRKRRKKGRW